MREPSRIMLPAPEVPGASWAGIAVLGVVLLITSGIPGWPLVLLLLVAGAAVDVRARRRARRIAAARAGESICTFARSFDRREVDPWILRAVYEELSAGFPVRREDELDADLELDPEDLEDAVVWIARRARRSLDGYEENPHLAQVPWRVEDLVLFLQAQPRLA